MSSVIYKIVHKLDTEEKDIYIGSTKDLNKRIIAHRFYCKDEKCSHFRIYKFINENGGFDNFNFVILLKCNDSDKKTIEQHFIDTFNPTLNCNNALGHEPMKVRAKKHYNNNKDKKKEYQEKNKEQIQIRTTKKYTCVCGAIIQHRCKSRHMKTKRHLDAIKP